MADATNTTTPPRRSKKPRASTGGLRLVVSNGEVVPTPAAFMMVEDPFAEVAFKIRFALDKAESVPRTARSPWIDLIMGCCVMYRDHMPGGLYS